MSTANKLNTLISTSTNIYIFPRGIEVNEHTAVVIPHPAHVTQQHAPIKFKNNKLIISCVFLNKKINSNKLKQSTI